MFFDEPNRTPHAKNQRSRIIASSFKRPFGSIMFGVIRKSRLFVLLRRDIQLARTKTSLTDAGTGPKRSVDDLYCLNARQLYSSCFSAPGLHKSVYSLTHVYI